MLRLGLPRLAGPAVSRQAPATPLARALCRGLRHRRGQQHLLPPRLAEGRGRMGRADPGRLPVRVQGEPLPDSRQEAERDRAGRGALLRGARGAPRGGQDGPHAVAAPAELSPRRRAARARAPQATARAPLLRVSRSQLVHRGGVRDPASPRRRAGDRGSPGAALPDPRADGRLDVHPLPFRTTGAQRRYSERELETWKRRIAAWRSDVEVLAYFDNDWQGHAVDNARWLKQRLS